MVRAFVGDSTMTSRRRAGALLVATYASLDQCVAIIHDRSRVPDVPVARGCCGGRRSGRNGHGSGRRTCRGGASTVTPSGPFPLGRSTGWRGEDTDVTSLTVKLWTQSAIPGV